MAAAAIAIRVTTEATRAIRAGRRRPLQTIRPEREQPIRKAEQRSALALSRLARVRPRPATRAERASGLGLGQRATAASSLLAGLRSVGGLLCAPTFVAEPTLRRRARGCARPK